MPHSFQGTCVTETGLPDFHLMTSTVMRKDFRKIKSKIINYRSYNNFSNEYSKRSLEKIFLNQLWKDRNFRNNYLKNKNDANRILYK